MLSIDGAQHTTFGRTGAVGERPAPDKTAKAIGPCISENVTAIKNFAEYLLSELQSAEALQPVRAAS